MSECETWSVASAPWQSATGAEHLSPNFMPTGPVDYVLIGMEPSLGAWAPSAGEARAKIAAGFRNIMWSLEDFILHTSARLIFGSNCAWETSLARAEW